MNTTKNYSSSLKHIFSKLEKAVQDTRTSLHQEKQVVYLNVMLLAKPKQWNEIDSYQFLSQPTFQELQETLSPIHDDYIIVGMVNQLDSKVPEYMTNYYQLKIKLPQSHAFNDRKLYQAFSNWQSMKKALKLCHIEYLKTHVGYTPMDREDITR